MFSESVSNECDFTVYVLAMIMSADYQPSALFSTSRLLSISDR